MITWLNFCCTCFFVVVFRYSLRIGCYRIPTHRRGAHRIFFIIPSYFKIKILTKYCPLATLCNKGLNSLERHPYLKLEFFRSTIIHMHSIGNVLHFAMSIFFTYVQNFSRENAIREQENAIRSAFLLQTSENL